MISSTTEADIYLNGTGQAALLFYHMPGRADRTVIIAYFARAEKLPRGTGMITIIGGYK